MLNDSYPSDAVNYILDFFDVISYQYYTYLNEQLKNVGGGGAERHRDYKNFSLLR